MMSLEQTGYTLEDQGGCELMETINETEADRWPEEPSHPTLGRTGTCFQGSIFWFRQVFAVESGVLSAFCFFGLRFPNTIVS